MKIRHSERLSEDVRARQRNTTWPDTVRNAKSDELLWKGSREATIVQRVGIAIFGLFFMLSGLHFAYIAHNRHDTVIAVFSIPVLLLGVKLFLNTFRY